MHPGAGEIRVSSRLDADPAAVGIGHDAQRDQRHAADHADDGPDGVDGLDPARVELGERIGRSWVFLFGLILFDYDDLTCQPRSRTGVRERSTMLSQRVWEHERTLEPAGAGCLVSDRVRWEPRLGLPGRPLGRSIGFGFRHRHRRQRRRFGGSPC